MGELGQEEEHKTETKIRSSFEHKAKEEEIRRRSAHDATAPTIWQQHARVAPTALLARNVETQVM